MPETPPSGDQVAVVDHLGLDHLGARGPQLLDGAVVGDGRAAPGQAGAVASMAPVQTVATTAPASVGGGDRRRQVAPLGLGPRALGAAVVPAAGDHQQVGPAWVERAVGPDHQAMGAGDLGRPVEGDQLHLEVGARSWSRRCAAPPAGRWRPARRSRRTRPPRSAIGPFRLDFGPIRVIAPGLSTRPS